MNPPPVMFPIAVEPAALTDNRERAYGMLHRRLLSTIVDHGILTVPERDEGALHEAIEGLDHRLRDQWGKAIKDLHSRKQYDRRPDAKPLRELLSTDGHIDQPAAGERLFVASRDVAERCGVDDSTLHKTFGESEIVLLGTCDESSTVAAVREEVCFPKDTQRSAIVDSFIRPLATRSSEVKVLDPYIFRNLLKGDAAHDVEWLIQALAGSMPAEAELSIYGVLGGDWKEDNRKDHELMIQHFVARALARRRFSLKVRVLLLQFFELKNRHIVFSTGHSYHVLHHFNTLKHKSLKDELRFVRSFGVNADRTGGIVESMERSENTRVDVTLSAPVGSVQFSV